MKKIGIFTNKNKDPELAFTDELIQWLVSKGCETTLAFKDEIKDIPFKNLDFIVCLGGDGTLLKAAGEAAVHGVPLIGINLGNMGYLTDATRSEAESALEKVLRGEYKLDKRMMLNTDLSGYDRPEINLSLNEIYIKGAGSKMMCVKLFINNEYIDSYRSDGIIFSTPTGSTAYNCAAGGPILKPDSDMIAITPICSHSLYTRPFVISADDCITVELSEPGAIYANVYADGKDIFTMGMKDCIQIKRSVYSTTIIKTNNLGFYDILRKKMIRPE